MSLLYEKIKEIHYYKLLDDRIKVSHGDLLGNPHTISRYFQDENGCIKVASEPGKVFYRAVWFEESNLEEAKIALLEYLSDQREELSTKLESLVRLVNIVEQTE